MSRAVKTYLVVHALVAAAVLAMVVVACRRIPLGTHWSIPLAVAAATALVLWLPVALPSTRDKRVKISDGAAFAAALVLMPAPWAALALSGGTVLRELASGRPARRRLHSVSANVVAYSVGCALVALLAGGSPFSAQLVGAILIGAYAQIAVYQLSLRGIVRAHGRQDYEALDAPLLGHDPLGDLAAMLAGIGLGFAGTYGPVPLGVASVFAVIAYVLHGRYQRLRVSQARLHALIACTDRINAATTATVIEDEVRAAARDVLGWPQVELTSTAAPDPVPTAAIRWPDGQVRWLHPGAAATALSQDYLEVERHLVGLIADVASAALERLDRREQLEHAAIHDQLTGLRNRSGMEEALHRFIAGAERDAGGFTVVYGDLDGFKDVNDRLGHQAGDAVLRTLADRLSGAVEQGDVVARVGGDEFVVLLQTSDADTVAAAVGRLQHAVDQPVELRTGPVRVHISLGHAVWPRDGRDEHELLDHADAAMYACKQARARHGAHRAP